MTKPNKSDWGKIKKGHLDAECAYKQFAGKSLAEAQKMFEKNALYYQEDLYYMPPIAFNYYATAFINYILSEKSKGDSDGASSFLYLTIEILKEDYLEATSEIKHSFIETAKLIANNQKYYEADIEIYGDFLDLHKQIVQLVG